MCRTRWRLTLNIPDKYLSVRVSDLNTLLQKLSLTHFGSCQIVNGRKKLCQNNTWESVAAVLVYANYHGQFPDALSWFYQANQCSLQRFLDWSLVKWSENANPDAKIILFSYTSIAILNIWRQQLLCRPQFPSHNTDVRVWHIPC